MASLRVAVAHKLIFSSFSRLLLFNADLGIISLLLSYGNLKKALCFGVDEKFKFTVVLFRLLDGFFNNKYGTV